MSKIRILYVITQLELGGAQTQLLSLIRGLDRERYEIFLFTGLKGPLVEEALAIPGLTIHLSKYLRRPIDLFRDILAVAELSRFIRKHQIDIVHTHSSKAGILGRCAGALAGARTIIHTVHGWSFNDFQNPLIQGIYKTLEKITARFASKIIVVSEHDKQKGLREKIGSETQYALVRYGIPRGQYGHQDPFIRKELGISDDEQVIGTIACFKPQKAPLDFVRLASLIRKAFPKARFLMIGDGVLRREIEQKIAQAGLESSFILTGWRRDIPRLLSAMDLFVLTSLWEGLPISVLEAMAGEIPVVTTDTGGVAEVILEGKTGFLVPCHNMSSMLEKARKLLENASLREQVTKEARRYIDERFDTCTMTRAHGTLYQELNDPKGKKSVRS